MALSGAGSRRLPAGTGIDEARRRLQEERYASAVAAGASMPINEAVHYALAVK